MTKKFKKKCLDSAIFEAVQYNGKVKSKILRWIGGYELAESLGLTSLIVNTPLTKLDIKPWDWIIKDSEGGFSLMPNNQFLESYKEINEEKYVVIKDMSAGNESVGDAWQETKIFDGETTLNEVMKWAMDANYDCNFEYAYSRRRITITKPHSEE